MGPYYLAHPNFLDSFYRPGGGQIDEVECGDDQDQDACSGQYVNRLRIAMLSHIPLKEGRVQVNSGDILQVRNIRDSLWLNCWVRIFLNEGLELGFQRLGIGAWPKLQVSKELL